MRINGIDRSGFKGPWTFSPTSLTNSYFTLLLSEKWIPKTEDEEEDVEGVDGLNEIAEDLTPTDHDVEEEEDGIETPVIAHATTAAPVSPAAPAAPTPSANPDDYRYFASEAAAEEFARRSPEAWRRMPYVNIGGQIVQNTDYTGM